MRTFLICVSISCPICGDLDSGSNRRGFSAFMRNHAASCGADGFSISESVEIEGVEE